MTMLTSLKHHVNKNHSSAILRGWRKSKRALRRSMPVPYIGDDVGILTAELTLQDFYKAYRLTSIYDANRPRTQKRE